jgi:hypothetical protein
MRTFVKSLVLAAILGGAAQDGSPQQAPAPRFRSGRDILTIDAAVRGKDGRPVTDLQPSDFVVTATATYGDFKRFETSTSAKFQN